MVGLGVFTVVAVLKTLFDLNRASKLRGEKLHHGLWLHLITATITFASGALVIIPLFAVLIPGASTGWGLFAWGFDAFLLILLLTCVFSFLVFRSDATFFQSSTATKTSGGMSEKQQGTELTTSRDSSVVIL